MTNLVQDPSSDVFNGQATADLASIASLLAADPFLAGNVPALDAASAAITAATTAAEVQGAATTLGQAITTLDTDLTNEAASQFTMFLNPDRGIALAGSPTTYTVDLQNTGSTATAYSLSVTGLPAGVTASFNESSVTLQPGEQLGGAGGVILSLSETGTALVPANFTVTAAAEGAPNVTLSAPGGLELNTESLAVATVTTTPPFVQPGTTVDVAATFQVVVNEPRSLSAQYTVMNPAGTVIFTSAPTAVPVTASSSVVTADLEPFATTSLSDGLYTIDVTLTDLSPQPLQAATGQGSLTVGLPVSASFSVSPSTLPSGSGTVTDTLQVNAQTALPDPLTLEGGISTGAPGTSVAIFGNDAYVGTTDGVDIFDVSNPASPALIGTLNNSQIFTGTFARNLVQVVGSNLYVASDYVFNSVQVNLLVYSLASPGTPTNPQLTGSTAIPYPDLGDLLVNASGSAAYLAEWGFVYENVDQHITDQFGTFLSVDLSSPAQPQLDDVLFNDNGPEVGGTTAAGGDFAVNGATLVNSQFAYLASTTSEGGNTHTGTGQVIVVDTSNPAQLAEVTSLSIPGTVQLSEIAVDGDYALVVGNTGGFTNPVPTTANSQFDGNVTLTLLDISNPDDPQIVGTTQILPETLPLSDSGFKADVTDLGNGDFAVSNTVLNGTPQLLVVGTSDPTNLAVAAISVPASVHGLTAANGLLYATTAQGLSIYQIGQLASVSVTVSVQVPDQPDYPDTTIVTPGSYNTGPDQTTTGTNFDTVVWNRALAFGNTSLTLSWQTELDNLAPGETRIVGQDATVDFTSDQTSGTIDLPDVTVTGEPIVSVSPAAQTAAPGATATYDVRLTNPTDTAVTYDLVAGGFAFPSGYVSIPSTVDVAAEGTADVTLALTTPDTTTPASEPFQVAVDIANTGVAGYAQGTLDVVGTPVLPPSPIAQGIVVNVTPVQATAGINTTATYEVQLTNVGTDDDTFSLAVAGLPSSVASAFSTDTIDVPPGASNSQYVMLSLSPSQAGMFPFTVTATSTTNPFVSGSGSATLNTVDAGAQVTLTASGTGFLMSVTNTADAADTFSLALGGPAALAATLGQTSVTLQPGDSQSIPITTQAANFALAGSLDLIATATSQNDPAVQASASASLGVPSTQGMSASFTPSVQVLSAPGSTSFVLMVQNSGTSVDSYSATITGSSGPVSADLTGLTGESTQSIPTFYVPALGTGAIVLNVNSSAALQGTVTVQVASLSDPSESTSVTAILTNTIAAPAFSNLSAPTITYGTATTALSGQIAAPGSTIPSGNVSITLNGVIMTAPIDTNTGDFSAVFSTATLGVASSPYTITYSFAGNANFAAASSSTMLTVNKATPTIMWASPDAITYGSELSGTQLDASASVAGTFAYTPAAGTILGAGSAQALSVLFTPTDSADYNTATGSVTIDVSPATPAFADLSAPNVTYGTATTSLSGQIAAPGSTIPSGNLSITLNGVNMTAPIDTNTGDFSAVFITAALGVASSPYTITYSFAGNANFAAASSSTMLTVNKATPTIMWAKPGQMTAGTALGPAQLDASASVPGSFTYTPPAGTVLAAGQGQALAVLFAPTDSADYTTTHGAATIDVVPAGTPPPPPTDEGPTVTGVERFGYHMHPTSLALTFSTALDPADAQNAADYKIVAPNGRTVGIAAVEYDAATDTVTLDPAHQLNLHRIYRLTVVGTGANGVRDTSGRPLDGADDLVPGSNYVTELTAANLVLGSAVPGGPARLAQLRREAARIARQELAALKRRASPD